AWSGAARNRAGRAVLSGGHGLRGGGPGFGAVPSRRRAPPPAAEWGSPADRKGATARRAAGEGARASSALCGKTAAPLGCGTGPSGGFRPTAVPAGGGRRPGPPSAGTAPGGTGSRPDRPPRPGGADSARVRAGSGEVVVDLAAHARVDVQAVQFGGEDPAHRVGLGGGAGLTGDRAAGVDRLVLLADLAVGVGDDVLRVGVDPE